MKIRTEYEVIEVFQDGLGRSEGTFEEKGKAVVKCMQLAKRGRKVRVIKRITQTELAWKPRGYDKRKARELTGGTFLQDFFEERPHLGINILGQ